MAFGDSMGKTQQKQKRADGDGEKVIYVWPWIPNSSGVRKFRVLPTVDNGVVLDEPASEVRFQQVWYDVNVGGETKPRRLILDWRNPWSNPIWDYVSKKFPKGSRERKNFKQMFAMNVLDLSDVVLDENGQPVYSDEAGMYRVSAQGKFVNVVSGTPQPLKQVRIFEGSAGDRGGNHMLQQMADLVGEAQDNDGNVLNLHEFDIRQKTTGEGLGTKRGVREVVGAKLNPAFALLPRYDIASWAKPYPDEMLERLLAKEDYNDLIEEYGIQTFPQLITPETLEVDEEIAAVFDEPVEPVKSKRKSKASFNDEDVF